MKFNEAMRNETRNTYTENGQRALNTSSNKCLDFFSVCGALRKADSSNLFKFEQNLFFILFLM